MVAGDKYGGIGLSLHWILFCNVNYPPVIVSFRCTTLRAADFFDLF